MKKCLIGICFLVIPFSNLFALDDNGFNRYLERAKRKINEGNYTEAIEALKKASEKESENAEIYYLMSDCQKKVKNYKEAARYYAYAKALDGRKDNVLLEGAVRVAKLF